MLSGDICQKLYQKLEDDNIDKKIQFLIKETCETVNKPKKSSHPSKYINTKGVHQGISISNILTEIYLIDFDREIKELVSYYDRYVDDIIIIVDNNNDNDEILVTIEEKLKKVELSLNKGKTAKINYDPRNKTIESQKTSESQKTKDKKFLFLGYTFLFTPYPNKESRFVVSIEKDKVNQKLTKIYKAFYFFNKYISDYVRREENTDSKTDNYSKKLEDYKKAATLEMQREIYGMVVEIYGMVVNKKIYGWLNYYTTVNDYKIFLRMYIVIKKQCEKYNSFFNIKDFISLHDAKKNILQKKLDYFPNFLEIKEESLIICILEINNIKYHKKSTTEQIHKLYKKLIIKKLKYIKLQLKHDTYIVK